MEIKFEHNDFGKRLKTMLKVDFRRMFTMRLFYIMAGICFAMPVLMLVMTSMFGGAEAGAAEAGSMFTNTWQAIGSYSGAGMSMDMTAMCNINMLYFFGAILVCLFVSEDFKSGYAKNLFTVRAKKSDYVISKTLVGIAGCAGMLISFFVGAVIGGAIAGLPFDTGTTGMSGVILCMLSKILLMGVFVAIYLVFSVIAKEKTWLSIILSFVVTMLLFMMVPSLTPLDATVANVMICLVMAVVFGVVLGVVDNQVLKRTSLV